MPASSAHHHASFEATQNCAADDGGPRILRLQNLDVGTGLLGWLVGRSLGISWWGLRVEMLPEHVVEIIRLTEACKNSVSKS